MGPRLSMILWRALVLILATALAWQIVATGMAAHYAERLERGDTDAARAVLAWRPNHPRGLYVEGIDLAGTDPEAALELLSRAYAANPTDPRPLLATSRLYLQQDRTDDADALARIADRLAPVNPSIQHQLALYWDGRGETAQALQHLSKAMSTDERTANQNLPVMLELAEGPTQRVLLERLMQDSPRWAPALIPYAARHATSVDVVRYLMLLRQEQGSGEITQRERIAYQNRLLQDGYTTEAYLAWLNTLEPNARRELGLLFNGGFELPPSNHGFGWHETATQQLSFRRARTIGTRGAQSLMIRFSNFDGRFGHLGQRLYLQPDAYRLSGSARLVDLETKGGLRWRLKCNGDGSMLLGQSAIFAGDTDWAPFSVDFRVPDTDCDTQDLRLVSAGRHGFELPIDGALWFDDMRILDSD